MTIRVALNHQTLYRFDRRISAAPHVVRLRPAAHTRTPILAYSLRVEPEEHFINWQQDPYGNYLGRIVFKEQMEEMRFEVDLIAEMTRINPFDYFLEEYATEWPFSYSDELKHELDIYLKTEPPGPLMKELLASIDHSERETNSFLVYVNQLVHKRVDYTIRMEPGVQSAEETLKKALGSCRDSGWLLVQLLRHIGLAARFVSGYLVQLSADPDQKSLDGPSGPDNDFTDLHAWCEVYLPGAGWVGLDPTSGLFAAEGHIPLSCTPEPGSAAPISGAIDECEVQLHFHNGVKRIHEDPRVTKPYSDEQWAQIQALGHQVDQALVNGDVRLTMGGEPTFVSIDDMESAQWNTAADGPHKRQLAHDLSLRLRETFAPGGVLHVSQGKWYPGEEVPRWQLACFWRSDGVAIWKDPSLLGDNYTDYGFGAEQARQFGEQLTRHLGVMKEHLIPGYEDSFYYLWKEGQLPVDVDPLKSNLKDELERRRIARLLDRGLNTPSGYVLPVRWNYAMQGWESTPWPLRREQLFLIPGDSPMGLRLPLGSLPWAAQLRRQKDPEHERSLFEDPPALKEDYAGEVSRRYFNFIADENAHAAEIQEQPLADAKWTPTESPKPPAEGGPDAEEWEFREIAHTALCIEARDGRLYAFLPPLSYLEHFLDLLSALEESARSLQMPIILEGYEPPKDWRLKSLKVTPDPGVIEVNIHPAHSWDEMVYNTLNLYEQARLARLGTEKFMLDGRHTGTGGGNHVTLGGATSADSPLLRRPDLLRSLVTYWQHHPGLSYLFSGMFIGPTSQAPRVDEARHENSYELEIAFQQTPEGMTPAPWLVDRLYRNLLVDLTGNTHRSEFCIDKLYSPDSNAGRQGLLELRAFEMPPHARMSLVQMLLIRALVARFWNEPYGPAFEGKLVRWGTAIHDRWMLPHFVQFDVEEVACELKMAGFRFDPRWFDPFLEFRFPHYGSVKVGDIALELRMAIEPWHVLGEESSNVGTARFVDSSVERVQVKVTGLTDSRYVVACNGRRVPLHSTGTHGEYVAGVRYRAWQPPSALHPTIGIHSPLVFDIIDTWNGRAVGGCTYHVHHPGGRSYDIFPINAWEAESRRIGRFWDHGHTPGPVRPRPDQHLAGHFYPEGNPPGPMAPPEEEINRDYPYTLDLRRKPHC